MGRNPRTGEEVPIAEKRIATFKPGKALKEQVQSGNSSVASEPIDIGSDAIGGAVSGDDKSTPEGGAPGTM